MDELENLQPDKILSVPYDEYFSDMELTNEERENRESFAEEFEKTILVIFALIAIMREYGYVNKEYVVSELKKQYSEIADKYVDIDDYMEEYIDDFSEEIVDTTLKHMDRDNWYLSDDRGILISENEATTVFNHSEFAEAIRQGKTMKQWIDIRDKRERASHLEVGGTALPIHEPFIVGDSLLLYPKDETYNPSVRETANCRCSIRYY